MMLPRIVISFLLSIVAVSGLATNRALLVGIGPLIVIVIADWLSMSGKMEIYFISGLASLGKSLQPRGRISVKRPKDFTPGAKLTVVTACKESERNIEYKAPSGKMYGSLSYYISILLKSDADFARWRQCFNDKSYLNRGIFQSIQHPSIEVFP